MSKQRITMSRGKTPSVQLFGTIGDAAQARNRATPAQVAAFNRALRLYNDSGDMRVFEEVGEFGIDLQRFDQELRALGDIDSLDVFINSPGGAVFDGLAMHALLKRHRAKVNVHVVGLAASIASVIAMAGDVIEIDEHARLMIHNPNMLAHGDADDFRKGADLLDSVRDTIVAVYRERTRQASITIAKWMDAETWFTADEAVSNGFADRIFSTAQAKGSHKVMMRLAQLEVDDRQAHILSQHPDVIAAQVEARLRQINRDAVKFASR